MPPYATVLFDGFCNLCDRSVRFMIANDPAARLRFAASQSPEGRAALRAAGISAPSLGSVVLIDESGAVFTKSEATLRIAGRLRRPWSLARGLLAVPRPLRDAMYTVVSKGRMRIFGRRDTCRVPTNAERARFLSSSSDA